MGFSKYSSLANTWVISGLFLACVPSGKAPSPPTSGLATILVGALDAPDYDKVRLSAFKTSEPGNSVLQVDAVRGQQTIQGQLPAGAYLLRLEYLKSNDVQYSSEKCDNPAQFDLKPGNNPLTIYVCDKEGSQEVVKPPLDPENNAQVTNAGDNAPNNGGADLDITPVYRQGSPSAAGVDGLALYQTYCLSCHGEKGQGGAVGPSLIPQGSNREAFVKETAATMPPSNPGACKETCAEAIASYLFGAR